jgi:hypothetical protein
MWSKALIIGIAILLGYFLSIFTNDEGDKIIKEVGKKALNIDIPTMDDEGNIR